VVTAVPTKLTATRLGHRFGRRRLFDDLSFELLPGEVLIVAGANGTGKSTLLRILAGVLSPVSGEVRLEIDGRVLEREERPLATGYVAPYLEVYDGYSVRENLAFIARARGMRNAGVRIESVMAQVGLSRRADDPVKTFSSGLRQRARFAAALISDPPLLLLDEPGSNLDDAGVQMVKSVVDTRQASGGLLIIATNDEREASWGTREVRVDTVVQRS
jgi:heme exporter protein A